MPELPRLPGGLRFLRNGLLMGESSGRTV
ncbi:MAG: hypothetical protein ACLRT5_15225 [Lachnospiraceae bacterium]